MPAPTTTCQIETQTCRRVCRETAVRAIRSKCNLGPQEDKRVCLGGLFPVGKTQGKNNEGLGIS